MNIKKLAYTVLATSVMALCANPAQAALILRLDAGGGNVVEILDNQEGDLDSTAGSVTWFGNLGTWMGNLTAGLSNAPGENGFAWMDLTSRNTTSRSGGSLIITLIDNGFTNPSGLASAITSVGGTTMQTSPNNFNSSVSFNSFLNGTSIGTLGAYGPGNGGAFSGTTQTAIDTTGGFELKQVATITHQGAGATSFDLMTTVPEPATLGLLGLGLVGMGFMRRRRAE